MSLYVFTLPLLLGGGAPAASQPVSLAQALPADTRIYFDLRDIDAVLASPAGTAVQALVRPLVRPATQPTTAPASVSSTRPASVPAPATGPATAAASAPATAPAPLSGWRQRLAVAMGIDSHAAAELLVTGRIAFAADAWTGLADAVLVAEPPVPAALEAELAPARVPESANQKVRLYTLAHGHELACDGRLAVVGRTVNPKGLYRRTVALWGSEAGVSLGDLAEYRERTAALPAGAQVLLYVNASSRAPTTRPGAAGAGFWLDYKSWAAAVIASPGGITVEADASLRGAVLQTQPAAPSVDLLARVPGSTLVGWSQRVDYAASFKELDSSHPAGVLRFYIDVLQAGLPRGAFERDVLQHLIGDTIFVIGQTQAAPPISATRPATGPADQPVPPLVLPTLAMMVRTDAPEAAERTLKVMSLNLLRLLNIQTLPDGPVTLRESALDGVGTVRTLDVGRLLASRSRCEFLRSLEFSWAVADGWLVIGSHLDAVRQLVRTRRGGPDSMPAQPAQDAVRQAQQGGGAPALLLVAQPRTAGEMIQSWITYVAAVHPEMLRAEWWEELHGRDASSGVQLGILSVQTTRPAVEVAQTIPGWPAHDRLLAGDLIVGVNGHALAPENPEGSLRALLASRGAAQVLLKVVRGGREQQVEIPMPAAPRPADAEVRPLELLRDAGALLRTFSSASYAVWQRSPSVVHARLELRFAP